ncbi:unnamed protein product [Mytilus edulis]|uniref:Stonustoxin-like helical domain-containing protein n=1 Tax=Mytilus edulis TaxID=6550 RepID=A0A8S3S7F8_MYTED|nr:unnamed protein product [Mytilus edulis]
MNTGGGVSEQDVHIQIERTQAFGRPFRLGMLYDRVHDTIPGETVLTMADMEKHIYEKKRHGCSFDVIYGDSLEDKSRVFNGDANLQRNTLFGILSLGGSGKFLKSKISSKKQLRVTLTAEYIMMLLKSSAEAELTMKDIDMQEANKISCKFDGDIILPVNPTTYEEAVRVYKELPSYLKEDEAVPVTVWLYPISEGVMPTNKVLQLINKEKMKQAIVALDDLQRIYVSCDDLMSGEAFMHVPEIQAKINSFRRDVQTYQEEFQDLVLVELLKRMNRQITKCHSGWLKSAICNTDIVLPFSSGQYVYKEPGTNAHSTIQQRASSVKQSVTSMQAYERHDTSTSTDVNSWYSDPNIKAYIRKTIKRFVTLNSKKAMHFNFFATFTDCIVPHRKESSCIHVVSYEDGKETKETDLFSTSLEEDRRESRIDRHSRKAFKSKSGNRRISNSSE